MQTGINVKSMEKGVKSIRIRIPRSAARVIDRLHENGFEAYIVGGCVRDSLIGITPGDWDITTSATPRQICGLFERTIETGIRPGEKLHEIMVTQEDSLNTWEYEKHYIVYPQITFNSRQVPDPTGRKVEEGFAYSSGTNSQWLSVEDIRRLLETVEEH